MFVENMSLLSRIVGAVSQCRPILLVYWSKRLEIVVIVIVSFLLTTVIGSLHRLSLRPIGSPRY